MAFTGVPVVKRVSDSLIRITGISLDADAVGTISLFNGTGEIKLPQDFQPTVYAGQGPGGNVTLQDSIELNHLPCNPIEVVKTGTTKNDWLATLTNLTQAVTNGAETQSAMFYTITDEGTPTILPGEAVAFPQAGPNVGGGIVAGGLNQFQLPTDGVYRVTWSVNFTAASQLQVALDGTGLPETVSSSGEPLIEDEEANQNNNTVLVTATAGQLLSIINPLGNVALNITDADGDLSQEQAPSLVIELVTENTQSVPATTGPLEIYVRHH